MNIGIYEGSIPPPVFIQNWVNGLIDRGYTIYIYGKAKGKNSQFSKSGIIQRKVPSTKIGVLLQFIYFLFRLIINQPLLYLDLINIDLITPNSDRVINNILALQIKKWAYQISADKIFKYIDNFIRLFYIPLR